MKDLFKHASSSWVRYDRYEWKKGKDNNFYITPAPNAMPKIYDPLKEYQQMVLDALNVGLMIRTSSKRKIRESSPIKQLTEGPLEKRCLSPQ